MRITFLLACVVSTTCTMAQETSTVYLDATDSTRSKYILLRPAAGTARGCLFLLPGMFQQGNDVLVQTDLAQRAAKDGLVTVIATLVTGVGSMGIDTLSQASLRQLIERVTSADGLGTLPFYIGGFSIGGTTALKYAELALANDFSMKPVAVFAIDSPLDLERMYNAMLRESRLPNTGGDTQGEGAYLLKRFRKEFGGTPADARANYHLLSPYSFSDTTQRAIKPLVRLPIRLYTEPDVLWWLADGADYSGMNAFDFAALTNELRRMGNTSISLITTQNKGYREPEHERHPHSWSIVDAADLLAWLKEQR